MFRAILTAVSLVILAASQAWAYIDPGTGGYVYSMLGPILAFLGAGLAFVFRPVRRLMGHVWSWIRPGKSKN